MSIDPDELAALLRHTPPVAWRIDWEKDHEYRDKDDPLPPKWEDVPNKVTPLYTAEDILKFLVWAAPILKGQK